MLPQETYFARDGVRDMFWPHAMNASAIAQVRTYCHALYIDIDTDICATIDVATTGVATVRSLQLDPWLLRATAGCSAAAAVAVWPPRSSRVATAWSRAVQHCDGAYGVVPRPLWIAEEFGGAAGHSLQPLFATNKDTRGSPQPLLATNKDTRTRVAAHVAPRRTQGAARDAVLP
jgi:hypothetical protein